MNAEIDRILPPQDEDELLARASALAGYTLGNWRCVSDYLFRVI